MNKAAESQIASDRDSRIQDRDATRRIATKSAFVALLVGKALGILVFAAGFVLTLPLPLSDIKSAVPQMILSLLLLVFGVAVLWQFATGGALNGVARRLEVKLAVWLEKRLVRSFHPSLSESDD